MLKHYCKISIIILSITSVGNSSTACVKVDGKNYTISLRRDVFTILQTDHPPEGNLFVIKCFVNNIGILNRCSIDGKRNRSNKEIKQYESAVDGSKLTVVRSKGPLPKCIWTNMKFRSR